MSDKESATATAPDLAKPAARHLWRLLQLATSVLVLALLALLAWKVATAHRGADLVNAITHDKNPPAPAFNLPVIWPQADTWPPALRAALADQRLSPRELRGHPVVFNFWASWCGPCKTEAPILIAAARAHAGQVVFVGVDVQDLTGDARRFLRRFHTPYVSLRDSSGQTYDDYGLTGVPETYWLDARGRLVAHYPGAISRRQLEAGITLARSR